MAGIKYSTELSCAIEMLVEKSLMLQIPMKPTLIALQVDDILDLFAKKVVPGDEYS